MEKSGKEMAREIGFAFWSRLRVEKVIVPRQDPS